VATTNPSATKAVEVALEWSKQIITLATGTIVLSGTFIKDIFATNLSSDQILSREWLFACWVAMLLAVIFSILFIGALTSLLSQAGTPDVFSGMSRGLAVLEVSTFVFGVVAFVVFVTFNLSGQSS
jgi:hypothetical protein